jgi:hypothetical protein
MEEKRKSKSFGACRKCGSQNWNRSKERGSMTTMLIVLRASNVRSMSTTIGTI